MNYDILIRGKYILTMDKSHAWIEGGAVLVEKDKIVKVCAAKNLPGDLKAEKTIEAGIVMPGLVNTHTHAAMAYFRGLADDLPLGEWLEKHIWPAEAKFVNPEFVRESGALAVLEMIKSGTTLFNDMYFFVDDLAGAAADAGIRAMIGEAIVDFPAPSYKSADEALDIIQGQLSKYHDKELIDILLNPHSVYACSEETLLKVLDLARRHKAGIHMHISETRKEVDDLAKGKGRSPARYLSDLGFFDNHVIAAHSIWLDGSDIAIYREKDLGVSHNPISNMKLASGTAPIPKMTEQGITVGLGTDGAASNNALDLFSEMRACALLHKADNADPAVMDAEQVVRMATIDGAKVLNKDATVGSLEPGKKADIITINTNKPHLTPIYNPYSHLVYCANSGDVENVIINGRVIMENREVKTMDEDVILNKANKFKIRK